MNKESGSFHRSLEGQVALITGGGRGIGQAVALELGRRGSAVAVLSRSKDQLGETVDRIEQSGSRAVAVTADVADADSVRAAVDEVGATLGDVDLLVNNAGANGVFGPLWEVDAAAWWSDVTVNLLGPFNCCAAVLPAMVARRSGRIINIASGTAGRAFPHNSAYAASKTALVRLTDCLALETAPHGVSVFALSPGTIRTELATGLERSESGRRWMRDAISQLQFVSPDLPANAVAFLAEGRGDALSGRWVESREDLAELARRADDVVADDALQLRRQKLATTPR